MRFDLHDVLIDYLFVVQTLSSDDVLDFNSAVIIPKHLYSKYTRSPYHQRICAVCRSLPGQLEAVCRLVFNSHTANTSHSHPKLALWNASLRSPLLTRIDPLSLYTGSLSLPLSLLSKILLCYLL